MASNHKLIMHAECLNHTELNYELKIRDKHQTSDSYVRRQTILRREIISERNAEHLVTYETNYDAQTDEKEVEESYANLREIYEDENKCTNENVRQIETLVVHLTDRIGRIAEGAQKTKLKPISDRLSFLHNEVIQFYTDNGTSVHNSLSNPNQNQVQANEMAELVERTVNRLLERRFPDQNSGIPNSIRNNGRSNAPVSNDFRQNSNSFEWYEDNDNVYDSYGRAPRTNDGHPPSSTRFNNYYQNSPHRINVLEWGVQFTGLDQSEDPKSLNVDTFIQKVQDYGIAENMGEREIMSKV